MHDQDKAILQSLVSVAWADGTFEARESEMLDALIVSFGANDEEANDIRSFAREKRSLEDIPLTELSAPDRRLLLNHAVVLSWVDGEQHQKEKVFLDKLCEALRIPDEEGKALMAAANERAQELLKKLKLD